jgi:hypothetical protein
LSPGHTLSDLVVIDLSLPTANLVWEMASVLKFLPPHRIFIIGVTRGFLQGKTDAVPVAEKQGFLDAVRAYDLAAGSFLESQPWMSYG